MTKAFIAEVLQESCELTQAGSRVAANDLIAAIVEQLKRDGKFVLPGFGKSFQGIARVAPDDHSVTAAA